MRAVIVDPVSDSVGLAEVAEPVPGPDDVLIGVRAAGLNRADLAVRAKASRHGPEWDAMRQPFVGGMELAGEILAVGPAVSGWQAGDRVMARGAGYAERAVVRSRRLFRVPDRLVWAEAGGLPIALTTAHEALAVTGRLTSGQAVVINAATSGLGVVLVQVAAALGAGVVIAASRSAAKLGVLADFVGPLSCPLITVATSRGEFVESVRELTQGRGADLIIDQVGVPVLDDNVAAAAIGGRIVQVGRLGGKVASVDLDELASKRLELLGLAFRSRTTDDLDAVTARCVDSLGPDLALVRPRVERTFALHDVARAQEQLASNGHVGKLVLMVDVEEEAA
jgi:NADPH:quinone reductase